MSNRSPSHDYPAEPEQDGSREVGRRTPRHLADALAVVSRRGTPGPVRAQRRQQVAGIGVLVAAQLADLLVTVYGLSLPGVVEANPVAVAVMETLGTVPGLVLLSLVSLGAVVSVTEVAARHCRATTVTPLWVRCLGYVPFALLSFAVAGHNLLVILL